MNTSLKAIIGVYRNIFKVDGFISEKELLEMIMNDTYIPPSFKSGAKLKELLDGIYELPKWAQYEEKRLEMYHQGMTFEEIATTEGKSLNCVKAWFKTKGIKKNNRPAATGTVQQK